MPELKPCPFCGGEEIIAEISYEEKVFRIFCAYCPASYELYFNDAGLQGGEIIGFSEIMEVIKEITDKWNTRTEGSDNE